MRTRIVVLTIFAALAVLSAAVPPASSTAWAQAPVQAPGPPAFGPQLLLVSGAAGREPDLARLGITIYAGLPAEARAAGSRYLASGSLEASSEAGRLGINVTVLDAVTAGKVYYWLEADSPGAALAVAASAGTVVFEDERQLLVALPASEEMTRLEVLLNAGARASRFDPIDIGPIATALPGTGLAAGAPALPAPAAAANPAIAALLPLITEAGLNAAVGDLSGDWPAAIGGRTVTIDTRNLLADHTADVEEYIYGAFSAMGLPVSYVPWTYYSFGGRNVVAEIPGTTHPERIWLVGGHFDDRNAGIYDTGYAPGADDNATGVAATLAIASALSGRQFADTIRFVAFGAEEYGEWGSKAYAKSLHDSGAQVVGYLDLDMIGYDGNLDRVVEIHSGTGGGSINLGSAFSWYNTLYGQGLSVELKTASASNFSDHSSFWPYGYSAVLAIENFYDDAIPRDRNPWYHTSGDQRARVNFDYVVRFARASLATVAELAGMIVTPAPPPPPPPPWCQDVVGNGGFEARTDWSMPATVNPAQYVNTAAHGGSWSARLGLLPGLALEPVNGPQTTLAGQAVPDGAAYSTVYQAVGLPAAADFVSLRFWYRGGTLDWGAADHQKVALLRSDNYAEIVTLMNVLEGDNGWKEYVVDVTPFKGQTVVLYFEVYNDDGLSPARTWMHVDDVSVWACMRVSLPVSVYLPVLIR